MKKFGLIFRLFIALILINLCVWIFFLSLLGENNIMTEYSAKQSEKTGCKMRECNKVELSINDTTISFLKEQIAKIAQLIQQAKKHVRGSKTADNLKKASDTINKLLDKMKMDQGRIYNRVTYKSRSVCPEQYMGARYGTPFYYKGFEVKSCNHSKPIWELVTIIKCFKIERNQKAQKVESFLSSTYRMSSRIHVLVGINIPVSSIKTSNYSSGRLVYLKHNSDGEMLNDLVREVRTPYVLIARNAEILTDDVSLERLVREIEQLNVTVAGGAFRNQNGQWKKGCFQTMYRNFTLKYLEGYDESYHECLFCDYIHGPFMTSVLYINEHKFLKLNEDEGLFEDWFLRVLKNGHEAIVCPDSMFNVEEQDETSVKWDRFMDIWNLYKCVTPSGVTMMKHCFEYYNEFFPTKAVPPCNLQYNANAVKIFMRICEVEEIICELQEGTALGAVKFEKILPWERDVDLTFLTANYSAIVNLKVQLRKERFGMSVLDERWCCVDNETAGGHIMMRYFGWNIELYGQHTMDSKKLTEEGIKPTKVLLDGQWVNVPRNPGLFVRNRYGREIYQHAEHWMSIGERNGWIHYKTNVFKECSNPGEHDCLDQYNADGSLPFIEMLP